MSVPVSTVRFKKGSVESELRLVLEDLDTAWPARAKKRLERLYGKLVAEAERGEVASVIAAVQNRSGVDTVGGP